MGTDGTPQNGANHLARFVCRWAIVKLGRQMLWPATFPPFFPRFLFIRQWMQLKSCNFTAFPAPLGAFQLTCANVLFERSKAKDLFAQHISNSVCIKLPGTLKVWQIQPMGFNI